MFRSCGQPLVIIYFISPSDVQKLLYFMYETFGCIDYRTLQFLERKSVFLSFYKARYFTCTCSDTNANGVGIKSQTLRKPIYNSYTYTDAAIST